MNEDDKLLEDFERELAAAKANSAGQYAPVMFNQPQKQNLVEWQLDFKPELEAIERSLRNDVLVRDKHGNEMWITNPERDKILLNDLGVSDVIKKIILLINKNKVLSNYKDTEIKERLKFICHGVRELVYLNYEYYGMDNDYKWNCYYSLIIDLDDMIESAYRRALNGEERRDLNQARMVQQSDPVMPNNINFYPQMGGQKRGLSKILPWNWMK